MSTGFAAWKERGLSLARSGWNAVPASMLSKSFVLIDSDRFRVESAEATYERVFTIDVEPTPHRIDIDFVDGPEAGNRCEGLLLLTAIASQSAWLWRARPVRSVLRRVPAAGML